jgi:tetratricopeptide (TPR) repeat protein
MGQAYLEGEASYALAVVRLRCEPPADEVAAVLEDHRARLARLGDSDSALARNSLTHIGIAAGLALGRYDEVEPLLAERLAWTAAAGFRRSEAILHTDHGRLLAGTGRWAESEAAFGRAIAICEEFGSRLQLAHTLTARAVMWQARGQPATAETDLNRAAALYEACGAANPCRS